MHELLKLDATEVARRVKAGDVTAVAVTRAVLDHARATEGRVGAYLHVNEHALEHAAAIDKGDKSGALAGVPVAIKDNIHVAGQQTSCASRILESFVAPQDATVTARLRAAGAVFVGKTNLDEFAMGSSCENSALKQTRNPFNLAHVPGGSSGGSAACVAARSAYLSLGSDTGGSIRLPASFCGVVGLKPSYGRVSRYGLVAFASSLDQVGPFSRSVRDAALCMNVLSGHDDHDGTSARRPVPDYTAALRSDLKGVKVGVVPGYIEQLPNREVADACTRAIEAMRALGAQVVEVKLPNADHGIAVYYVVASAEASSNLARFDGVRYGLREPAASGIEQYFRTRGAGFGPEVKRRIMLGTYALSAGHWEEFYGRAARVRTLILRDFDRAFEGCDVIVGPCAPFPAFKAGEISDPLSMYLCDVFTIPASLAGLCALSLPIGFDASGLPIGLHVQAPAFAEDSLLSISHALEGALKQQVDRMPKIA
ncbi:MAG: Asp-tRNA(Asn)/Glu-tRNA(Gln) amidotransferase subunit GatA [Planctomycetes bacterium]|nr:Asp-tRNA(Asn)/Glu-tRNA(Gln) amidotransferase subunit GatA [Planctomycetota bacterium]MCW8136211.1 Asp-tRNA(Asn)/Glu-tRNA(Gln) amidotransferase subunit GatA [Planctomycetota bacterium]